MKLSEIITPEHIILDLAAPSKSRLMHVLSDVSANHLHLGQNAIFAALDKREKLGSTGIGEGIAIPHAPVPGLAKPFALFARLSKPIDFNAIDENPVDIVVVLLTPAEKPLPNLSLLACLARTLRKTDRIARIRTASDVADVHRAIVEEE